jgi:hypothetical protein
VDRMQSSVTWEPTLVRDVDLLEPMPEIPGGAVARAWLMLRVGGVPVGDLRLVVPDRGLSSADVGTAVAARLGQDRPDQVRSRRRGRISPA